VKYRCLAACASTSSRSGQVKKYELERENGKLLYSYDIATKGKGGIDEVHVDAITGTVIGHVMHENAATEKAEAKAEAKEKKEDKAGAKETKAAKHLPPLKPRPQSH
jgi:hypothetical protein